MTYIKLNINTGADDTFKSGWKHQQNNDVVEKSKAEYMMCKFIFGLDIVAMAVLLISLNFSVIVLALGDADGGLGNVVSKSMLTKVKINSNASKTPVP